MRFLPGNTAVVNFAGSLALDSGGSFGVEGRSGNDVVALVGSFDLCRDPELPFASCFSVECDFEFVGCSGTRVSTAPCPRLDVPHLPYESSSPSSLDQVCAFVLTDESCVHAAAEVVEWRPVWCHLEKPLSSASISTWIYPLEAGRILGSYNGRDLRDRKCKHRTQIRKEYCGLQRCKLHNLLTIVLWRLDGPVRNLLRLSLAH